MSTICINNAADQTLAALVSKALDGAPVSEDSLEHVLIGGPGIAGHDTQWWHWALRGDVPDLVVPSCLEEGDPDDAPYPCREGLLVRVMGSSTVYLEMVRKGSRWSGLGSKHGVLTMAREEIFSPRPDGARVVPAAHVQVRNAVADALRGDGFELCEDTLIDSDLDVAAGYSWVDLRSWQLDGLQVEPSDGGLTLNFTTRVYVEGELDSDEAQELAREVSDREFSATLGALGFAILDQDVLVGDADEFAGSCAIAWEATVPDAGAVPRIVRALLTLDTPQVIDI
jgi:hypothetical protein